MNAISTSTPKHFVSYVYDPMVKKIARCKTGWRDADFQEQCSLLSVLLIFFYLIVTATPFSPMWLLDSIILIGLSTFLAPILMKLIHWKPVSILFLRSSIIAALVWISLFYIMCRTASE